MSSASIAEKETLMIALTAVTLFASSVMRGLWTTMNCSATYGEITSSAISVMLMDTIVILG